MARTPLQMCLTSVDSLDLDIRAWTCARCQTHHDRDINAAINIRNEALRILRVHNSPSHGECKTHSRQALGTRGSAVLGFPQVERLPCATANGGNVRQPGKTSVLLDAIPHEVGNPILLEVG